MLCSEKLSGLDISNGGGDRPLLLLPPTNPSVSFVFRNGRVGGGEVAGMAVLAVVEKPIQSVFKSSTTDLGSVRLKLQAHVG